MRYIRKVPNLFPFACVYILPHTVPKKEGGQLGGRGIAFPDYHRVNHLPFREPQKHLVTHISNNPSPRWAHADRVSERTILNCLPCPKSNAQSVKIPLLHTRADFLTISGARNSNPIICGFHNVVTTESELPSFHIGMVCTLISSVPKPCSIRVMPGPWWLCCDCLSW